MKRRGLAVFALCLGFATPLAAPAATAPALRIIADAPLTLRATGFRPVERVTVTVQMGDRLWSRSVRATASGRFTVSFKAVRLNYCALPLSITARGATTGPVQAKIPIRECANP